MKVYGARGNDRQRSVYSVLGITPSTHTSRVAGALVRIQCKSAVFHVGARPYADSLAYKGRAGYCYVTVGSILGVPEVYLLRTVQFG